MSNDRQDWDGLMRLLTNEKRTKPLSIKVAT